MGWLAGAAVAVAGLLAVTVNGSALLAGDLDDSFGTDGVTRIGIGRNGGVVHASALQPNGKIVVAGHTYGDQDFVVARVNADGALDSGFGERGVARTRIDLTPGGADNAQDVALAPDGKIVVVGSGRDDANQSRWVVVRYTSRGALDRTFSGDGIMRLPLRGSANGVAVQRDGKIVAVGSADSRWTVLRVSRNGSADSTFGGAGVVQTPIRSPNVGDVAKAVAVLGDGRIVVGGTADLGLDSSDFAAVRYLPGGEGDPSFGANGVVVTANSGPDAVTDLDVLPGGRTLLTGFVSAYDPGGSWFRLVRYLANGALDSGFGAGGIVFFDLPHSWYSDAYSTSLQRDGKLIVAGSGEPDYSYREVFALARFNPDGSLDRSFGDGGTRVHDFGCDEDPGYSAVVQPAGADWPQSPERIIQVGSTACSGDRDVAVIAVLTSGVTPPNGQYRVETRAGQPIVAGTTRLDNSCNDCTTKITLPWTVWAYGIPYREAHVSSNGTVQFNSASPNGRNMCLPWGNLGPTFAPYWDDLWTSEGGGIFTGVSGAPGSRQFVIEWRNVRQYREGTANFEVLLTEGSPHVSFIYGATPGWDPDGASATAGINRGATLAHVFSCWQERLVPGLRVDYIWEGGLLPPPPPRAARPRPRAAMPRRCRVPPVAGRSLRVARARIRRAGCRVGTVRRARSRRRAGIVLRQAPRAGSTRRRGARVSLVVSRGRR